MVCDRDLKAMRCKCKTFSRVFGIYIWLLISLSHSTLFSDGHYQRVSKSDCVKFVTLGSRLWTRVRSVKFLSRRARAFRLQSISVFWEQKKRVSRWDRDLSNFYLAKGALEHNYPLEETHNGQKYQTLVPLLHSSGRKLQKAQEECSLCLQIQTL